jgi:hypothetical protein
LDARKQFGSRTGGPAPILVSILLLFLDESVLVFFLFVCFLARFQLRGAVRLLERRAALITTDGVAFVHIFSSTSILPSHAGHVTISIPPEYCYAIDSRGATLKFAVHGLI